MRGDYVVVPPNRVGAYTPSMRASIRKARLGGPDYYPEGPKSKQTLWIREINRLILVEEIIKPRQVLINRDSERPVYL